MTEKIDCSKCCCIDYWQDTDDYGNYISAPIESCLKGHDLYPEQCCDFKDEW